MTLLPDWFPEVGEMDHQAHGHDSELLERIKERERRILSPQEQLIQQKHREYHQKHQGHEQMHMEM